MKKNGCDNEHSFKQKWKLRMKPIQTNYECLVVTTYSPIKNMRKLQEILMFPPLKIFLQKHYLKETNYLTENIPNVTTSTANVNQSKKHTSSKK